MAVVRAAQRPLRAFSLIEVALVVAMLGVASALAIPNLLPLVHQAQLDQDSIIVNNVSSSSGAATTALNQALVTFMEGAW